MDANAMFQKPQTDQITCFTRNCFQDLEYLQTENKYAFFKYLAVATEPIYLYWMVTHNTLRTRQRKQLKITLNLRIVSNYSKSFLVSKRPLISLKALANGTYILWNDFPIQ